MAETDATRRRPTVVGDAADATRLRAPLAAEPVAGPRRADVRAPRASSGRRPSSPKPKTRAPRLSRAREWLDTAARIVRPVVRRARTVLGMVSSLGWTLVVLVVVCWILAAWFGWLEFAYVTVALLLLLVISAVFLVGRLNLDVRLDVDPLRVSVGDSAAAQVVLVNRAKAPTFALSAEVPVGLSTARYTVPPLRPGSEHSEMAIIPTKRRGVIDVGPVTTQRGDPFRIFRREVHWSERYEVFVHPRTVMIESLGSGLLRDLEGQTTNDVSMSDLAFHTLRPYVAGDDRRYIHWRSSAKASATSGQDQFLVRQFLDTRRSHIGIIVDVDAQSYESEEDFELAISAGASIAVRALTDQMDLTITCGEHAAVQPMPHTALDTFSRAGFEGAWSLAKAANRVNQLASDVSSVILCTGTRATLPQFLRAKAHLAPEVTVLALCARGGAPVALRETSGISVLTIGALADMQRVVAAGAAA